MSKVLFYYPKKVKDFSVSSKEFELEYDSKDKLLKTVPLPEDLENYYPKEEYISHQNFSKGLVGKIYQLVKKYSANQKIKLFKKLVSPSTKVLDYGAGNGYFVSELIANNWNAFGVEPSSFARQQAKENFVVLTSSLEELTEEKFSVISLWHVLEHIPNYKLIIQQLYDSLEDGGYLILALPNFKSWDAHHYKSFWAAFDVPRHAYHFSKESISILAKDFNFNLIKIKPMLFDSFYVSYLSEKNKKAFAPFLKGIFFGFLSNLSGFFKREHSSQLYLLQKPKKTK